MNTLTRRARAGLAALMALLACTLAACGSTTPRDTHTSSTSVGHTHAAVSASQPPAHDFDASSTVNDYKTLAAEHILAANADQMFSGQIPPILRSIVVLNLSVDKDGTLTRAVVQRSRNERASALALGAVRRVGASFPKPLHLIGTGYRTLDYSETFLFNDDLLFQIRTLAGVQ